MKLSRRRFLRQLTVLGGASLLTEQPLWAQVPPVWVAVGPASDFAKNTFIRIVLPPEQHKAVIYVGQLADGSFLALSARCTHKGCEVTWDRDEREFFCPCHGGRFDPQGHRTGGPPRMPLPVLPTKTDAQGRMFVLA